MTSTNKWSNLVTHFHSDSGKSNISHWQQPHKQQPLWQQPLWKQPMSQKLPVSSLPTITLTPSQQQLWHQLFTFFAIVMPSGQRGFIIHQYVLGSNYSFSQSPNQYSTVKITLNVGFSKDWTYIEVTLIYWSEPKFWNTGNSWGEPYRVSRWKWNKYLELKGNSSVEWEIHTT